MLSSPHADPCQHSVKIYTSYIMKGPGCGCGTGGARRTRRTRYNRARSAKRRNLSRKHTRSRKHQNRRRSRRGGGATRLIPQGLVNTFRTVSNAFQTKLANITGGHLPISPSVLVQTPIKRPNTPFPLNAIRPIKTTPNSAIKKVSPFRTK